MKIRIAFSLYSCFLLILLSCGKENQQSPEVLSQMECLIRDYHKCYNQHWGDKHCNDTLEVNVSFFQNEDSVFASVEGNVYDITGIEDVWFYMDDSNSLRSDILGYCRLGVHGLSIYNTIDKEHQRFIESYVKQLKLINPEEKFVRHQELLKVYPHIDFQSFICVYKIDSIGNFCLVDSGYNCQIF